MTPAEVIARAAARCEVDVASLHAKYGCAGIPAPVARARRLAAYGLVHHVGLTRSATAREMSIRTGAVWEGVAAIERELAEASPTTHADVRHVMGLPELLEGATGPLRPRLPIVEPRTACPPKVRECRHSWCRYNLGPDGSTTEMCALEVAQEDGAQTLEEIGKLFGGMSRERVRQIEGMALKKYRAACELYGIEPEVAARGLTHWETAELAALGRMEGWRR